MVFMKKLSGCDLRYFTFFGYRYHEIPLTCCQQLLVLTKHHCVGLQYLRRSLFDKCYINFTVCHIVHRMA